MSASVDANGEIQLPLPARLDNHPIAMQSDLRHAQFWNYWLDPDLRRF
ncbi:hypothetical protein [uncultured Kiloniella sp.]|nr:hypothetical protein [uncultured Kiloniella sp.]